MIKRRGQRVLFVLLWLFTVGRVECQVVLNEVSFLSEGGTETGDTGGIGNGVAFIELLQVGMEDENLSSYRLEVAVFGVSENSSSSFALPDVVLAGGSFFVVCPTTSSLGNCDVTLDLVLSTASAVVLAKDNTTVDALSWTSLVVIEGYLNVTDSSFPPYSGLSRIPNGADTDQNEVDFMISCVTPGELNSPTALNCTSPQETTTFSEETNSQFSTSLSEEETSQLPTASSDTDESGGITESSLPSTVETTGLASTTFMESATATSESVDQTTNVDTFEDSSTDDVASNETTPEILSGDSLETMLESTAVTVLTLGGVIAVALLILLLVLWKLPSGNLGLVKSLKANRRGSIPLTRVMVESTESDSQEDRLTHRSSILEEVEEDPRFEREREVEQRNKAEEVIEPEETQPEDAYLKRVRGGSKGNEPRSRRATITQWIKKTTDSVSNSVTKRKGSTEKKEDTDEEEGQKGKRSSKRDEKEQKRMSINEMEHDPTIQSTTSEMDKESSSKSKARPKKQSPPNAKEDYATMTRGDAKSKIKQWESLGKK